MFPGIQVEHSGILTGSMGAGTEDFMVSRKPFFKYSSPPGSLHDLLLVPTELFGSVFLFRSLSSLLLGNVVGRSQ